MEHRSSTVVLHWFLSWACHSIWVHCRPICRSSCLVDLLQLLFGLQQFRLPWGFQKSACLVTLLCGFLSVWPIHFHFFLLVWVVIFSSWVFASRSSLLMVFGHLTPRTLRLQGIIKFCFLFGLCIICWCISLDNWNVSRGTVESCNS